jgi:hypothetical protein
MMEYLGSANLGWFFVSSSLHVDKADHLSRISLRDFITLVQQALPL